MKEAYDLKVLGEKLKARGLDLAEDALIILIEESFSWVEDSAKISETPYDDMGLIVLPQLKSLALSGADKIDGKEG